MYDRVKGFRDFYPPEMGARREVFDTLEATVRSYGFREIGTPALERTAMYAEKSGEEIVDELYHFTDQGARDVALTPELTPTVARMVAARGQELSKPIKWYSTRPFWRYEEPQSGRFREFYQTNVDVFGPSTADADAEVLACAADALAGLGVGSDDVEFRVSHRDVLSGLLATFDADVDTDAAIRAVDKRSKVEDAAYLDLLTGAGLSLEQAEEFDAVITSGNLDAVVEFADTETVSSAVDRIRAVLERAERRNVREYCTLSLTTARGLDYYTGIVFECFETSGAVNRSIFGGGRYDDLIGDIGGPETPAVGFAIGDATLTQLCRSTDTWPSESVETDYYVLRVGDTRPMATRIARELRARGHVVETDLSGRGFGAQLDYADGIDAETVVIVGERDLENDDITIKDMASGDQVAVPVDAFPGDHERPTYADFT